MRSSDAEKGHRFGRWSWQLCSHIEEVGELKRLLQTSMASMRMVLWWLRITFSAGSQLQSLLAVLAKSQLECKWTKWLVHSEYSSPYQPYTLAIFLVFFSCSHEHCKLQISFSQPRTLTLCYRFLFHSRGHSPYATNYIFIALNTEQRLQISFSQPWTFTICLKFLFSQPGTFITCLKYLFHSQEHWPDTTNFFFAAKVTYASD
jgi:hypothetical protein